MHSEAIKGNLEDAFEFALMEVASAIKDNY
jgi:hypothetical protein